ncbi:toxin-antitoxin system YwqK family antitoxin [Pedosphaera parvula]|uniref:MORN variant repeat protein n=1 Tax=Pedosphaera parvula (strain Ellin514) TaxID=320771 RepID=B9XRR7_PEDPL|nr:toxin-antitoxin system YwqK family antitoxin [Pedosphaera parvula]EEF57482.1 conserved hypothetical protein [Pedosphaera parvula Ellin514]
MNVNAAITKILMAWVVVCLASVGRAEGQNAKKTSVAAYKYGIWQKAGSLEELEQMRSQMSCPRGAHSVAEKTALFQGDPGIMVGCKAADGTLDGIYMLWYPTSVKDGVSGSLYKAAEGVYTHGKKQGLWMSWREDGSKIEQGKYATDRKNGIWTTWYGNGQKDKEIEFKDGVEKGLAVHWYENGQKGIECHVDGLLPSPEGGKPVKKLVGRYTNWDASGRMTMEGFYSKKGEGTGTWTTWSEDGTKEQSEYKNGKRDGDWTIWHPNGKKWVQGKWKDGERVGPTTYYYNNGKVDHVEK